MSRLAALSLALALLATSAGGAAEHRFLISAPTYTKAHHMMQMSHAWRADVHTFVVTNGSEYKEIKRELNAQHGTREVWVTYPDGGPECVDCPNITTCPRPVACGWYGSHGPYWHEQRYVITPSLANVSFWGDYDWLLVADAETIWFMDNVRAMLRGLDPDTPWYFSESMYPGSDSCCVFPGREPTVKDGCVYAPAPNPKCTRDTILAPGTCAAKHAPDPPGALHPRPPGQIWNGGNWGLVLSKGLMGRIRVEQWNDCVRCINDFNCYGGGDVRIGECVWWHGWAPTLPNRPYDGRENVRLGANLATIGTFESVASGGGCDAACVAALDVPLSMNIDTLAQMAQVEAFYWKAKGVAKGGGGVSNATANATAVPPPMPPPPGPPPPVPAATPPPAPPPPAPPPPGPPPPQAGAAAAAADVAGGSYVGSECHPHSVYAADCPLPGLCVPPASRCVLWRSGAFAAPPSPPPPPGPPCAAYAPGAFAADRWLVAANATSQPCDVAALSSAQLRAALSGHVIALYGDSVIRQLFMRLVFAARNISTVVERYFHADAFYVFNDTHDFLGVSASDGGDVLGRQIHNASALVRFLWSPMMEAPPDGRARVHVAAPMYWYSGETPGSYIPALEQFTAKVADIAAAAAATAGTPVPPAASPPPVLYVSTPVWPTDAEAISAPRRARNAWVAAQRAPYIPFAEMAASGSYERNAEDGIHFQCSFVAEYIHEVGTSIFKAPPGRDCRDMLDLNAVAILAHALNTQPQLVARRQLPLRLHAAAR